MCSYHPITFAKPRQNESSCPQPIDKIQLALTSNILCAWHSRWRHFPLLARSTSSLLSLLLSNFHIIHQSNPIQNHIEYSELRDFSSVLPLVLCFSVPSRPEDACLSCRSQQNTALILHPARLFQESRARSPSQDSQKPRNCVHLTQPNQRPGIHIRHQHQTSVLQLHQLRHKPL